MCWKKTWGPSYIGANGAALPSRQGVKNWLHVLSRLSIRFSVQLGRDTWQGVEGDHLFDDIIQPVCSLAFLRQHAPDTRYPQAVLRTRLLVSHYRPKTDWNLWARANQYADEIDPTPTMSFSTSVLTWQAAEDGLGVAMGQMALLDKDLADGRLVAPFNLPVATGVLFI